MKEGNCFVIQCDIIKSKIERLKHHSVTYTVECCCSFNTLFILIENFTIISIFAMGAWELMNSFWNQTLSVPLGVAQWPVSVRGLAGNRVEIGWQAVLPEGGCVVGKQAGWGWSRVHLYSIRPLCVLYAWCVCLCACWMRFPHSILKEIVDIHLPVKTEKAHNKGRIVAGVEVEEIWWMGGQ